MSDLMCCCYSLLSSMYVHACMCLSVCLCAQGIYVAVVYFFVACHTLTWKHRHYPIKEEVEPISIPEPPNFFDVDMLPGLYDSQKSLLPQVSKPKHFVSSIMQKVFKNTQTHAHKYAHYCLIRYA